MEDISGNKSAHEEEVIALIAQQQPVLLALIRSLIPYCSEINDVLQETNLVIWRKRESYKSGTNFNAWAARIARFQVMAWVKKNQRAQETPFDEELMGRIETAALARFENMQERRDALGLCLASLNSEQRALIEHRYVEKAPLIDFAKKHGRTYAAICKLLERVRSGLRECINQRLEASL